MVRYQICGVFDKIVHIYTEISAKQGILCTKSIFYSFFNNELWYFFDEK